MAPMLYQEQLDEVLVYERCESFGGGVDGYTRSTLLPLDAFQYGENTLVPDNMEVRTRPGADLLGTARAAKIQGALYFDTPSVEQLIVGSDAKLWHWNGSAWTEMTGWTLSDAALAFSAAQGVEKVLFTDGTQQMRTWDGTAWSGALGTTDNDPPAGATILLWHAGRMWAAGFAGGTSGKENDAIWASALLDFGTGKWDKADRNFRVGGGEGDPIVALASLQDFTMAVLKQNSIHLIHTDPSNIPAQYSSSIAPEILSYGIGCVGKRALCVYGNDLLFVSPDKNIYSLQRMQAAVGQYQLSAPLSLPIQPYIDRINWNVANLIAVKKYRELALFSVPLDESTVPNTVLVWNGRLGKWVGIWTGWTPNCWEVTRFSGVQRLVYGDNTGKVRQWKDFEDADEDDTYLDDADAIPTTVWTRAMLFGEPLNEKDPYHFEARFSASNSIVTITLVADNSDLKQWTADVRKIAPTLPLTLPFELAQDSNIPARRGLRGLSPFNECYFTITSSSGWFALRNVSVSAAFNSSIRWAMICGDFSRCNSSNV